MKTQLLTLALAGLFGALVATDASACCHKKQACPTPVTCAVVEPCPPPPPPVCEPVCAPAPKHCGLFHHNAGCGHKKFGGFCHKKATCAPAPVVCETPCYAAPVSYPSAQGYPTPQASGQGS